MWSDSLWGRQVSEHGGWVGARASHSLHQIKRVHIIVYKEDVLKTFPARKGNVQITCIGHCIAA
jgi:hypothetical protein